MLATTEPGSGGDDSGGGGSSGSRENTGVRITGILERRAD